MPPRKDKIKARTRCKPLTRIVRPRELLRSSAREAVMTDCGTLLRDHVALGCRSIDRIFLQAWASKAPGRYKGRLPVCRVATVFPWRTSTRTA